MHMIVCPGCERPNGQAARFCLYCGYRFHAEPAGEERGQEAPRAAEVREAQVCDHCAAPLHDRPGEPRLRCDYCGTLYKLPGAGGAPVVIIQNAERPPGGFEGANDPGRVLGEVMDTLLTGASRRSGDWELFKFGRTGCLLALMLFPVRIAIRTLFRI